MFLTVIVLVEPSGAQTVVDPDAVKTALARHHLSGPIEHIRVRTSPGEVHIGVLSLTQTQADADAAASRLCRDTIEAEPGLRGWLLRAAPSDRLA